VEAEPVETTSQEAVQQNAATADVAKMESLEGTPVGGAAASPDALFLSVGQAEGADEPTLERGAKQLRKKKRVKKPVVAFSSSGAGQGKTIDADDDDDDDDDDADPSPVLVGKIVEASADTDTRPSDRRAPPLPTCGRVSGASLFGSQGPAEHQEAVGKRRSFFASIFTGRQEPEDQEGAAQQKADGKRRSTFASIFTGWQEPQDQEGAEQQEAIGKRRSTFASIFAGRQGTEDQCSALFR
jgi:hypothetical protein